MMKIYIDKPAYLEAVGVILIRNGYRVNQGKEKSGTKIIRFLEVDRRGGEGI